MASREELLKSIKPGMKLTKNFFLQIYGYELTWPGFAENALTRLEILGCNKARNYYTCMVAEYNHNHEKEMKNVAKWLKEKEFGKKGDDQSRKIQREVEQRKADLRQKSDSELLTLLQKLSAENDL